MLTHRPGTPSRLGTDTGPTAIFVPRAGRRVGAHLALSDWVKSLLYSSRHSLAALPAVKFIFKFRLRGTLSVHRLCHPSEPPQKCNLNLPNFFPSGCPMGSGSHLPPCPHLLPLVPVLILCQHCCDMPCIVLPRGLGTCCLCLSSFSHHSGLCSDVTFQKTWPEIGRLHWHPVLYPPPPPAYLIFLSTLYSIGFLVGLLPVLPHLHSW